MKKIDKLIATSFIGPAILSYFVATFVLVMQLLWKYIDEIIGKGLSIFDLLELIFYYAMTLIPMAVPITVLISSVMVFGDMAEKYELSSMKSAGVSLLRIMLPSIVLSIFIGVFSIFASNYLKPASLLQFTKRFIAIRQQKSAFAIEQGIFNNAFNETIIRVGSIDDDKRTIHDVLIYDHTPNDKSLIGVISSKSGEMYTLNEGKYFVMKMDTGVHYREMDKRAKNNSSSSEIPFMRTYFDEWTKTFDLSIFDGDDGLLDFNRNREDMMNAVQLVNALDTFKTNMTDNRQKYQNQLSLLFYQNVGNQQVSSPYSKDEMPPYQIPDDMPSLDEGQVEDLTSQAITDDSEAPVVHYQNAKDSLRKEKDKYIQQFKKAEQPAINQSLAVANEPIASVNLAPITKKVVLQHKNIDFNRVQHFMETVDSLDYRDVAVRAMTDISRDRDQLLTLNNFNMDIERKYQKYTLRLHQQFSWALICVIFLFIGAPLGSIIRKGGYGYPLLVAILFYMIFVIMTIFGEKMVRNDTLPGLLAAWLPCLVLTPFAAFLTIMAIRDIKFNPGVIWEMIYKVIKK